MENATTFLNGIIDSDAFDNTSIKQQSTLDSMITMPKFI